MHVRDSSSALRAEIRQLREAIQTIKQDLPPLTTLPAPSFELDGDLMSFRPGRPTFQDLATNTEESCFDPPISTGEKCEDEIQKDLSVIKDEIEGLKTVFSHREAADTPTNRAPSQDQLIEVLAELKTENRLLKEMLRARERPATRRKSATGCKARGRSNKQTNLCENCTFLQSKGFESDLCYRHRAESYKLYAARQKK